MIPTIFLLIIICSLISVGFFAASRFEGDTDFDSSDKQVRKQWAKPAAGDRMILWWVRYYGGRWIGSFWAKPLYNCLPCMGSIHSIIPTYLVLQYENPNFFIVWPFVALATCGLNYLITQWWSR